MKSRILSHNTRISPKYIIKEKKAIQGEEFFKLFKKLKRKYKRKVQESLKGGNLEKGVLFTLRDYEEITIEVNYDGIFTIHMKNENIVNAHNIAKILTNPYFVLYMKMYTAIKNEKGHKIYVEVLRDIKNAKRLRLFFVIKARFGYRSNVHFLGVGISGKTTIELVTNEIFSILNAKK